MHSLYLLELGLRLVEVRNPFPSFAFSSDVNLVLVHGWVPIGNSRDLPTLVYLELSCLQKIPAFYCWVLQGSLEYRAVPIFLRIYRDAIS